MSRIRALLFFVWGLSVLLLVGVLGVQRRVDIAEFVAAMMIFSAIIAGFYRNIWGNNDLFGWSTHPVWDEENPRKAFRWLAWIALSGTLYCVMIYALLVRGRGIGR